MSALCTPARLPTHTRAGALEVALARSLVHPPPEQPILHALAMLRMRDAERVALHNEMEHVQVRVGGRGVGGGAARAAVGAQVACHTARRSMRRWMGHPGLCTGRAV